MNPPVRPLRIVSPIAAPLHPVALDYPDTEVGGGCIKHHRVAPGLEGVVEAYVRDTYGVVPRAAREDFSLHVDPGGCTSSKGAAVLVDAGGFYVQTLLDVLAGAVQLLEGASEKVYGGISCVRLQSFPGCIVVMLPEHRDAALRQLRPLVDEATGERIAMLQRLSKSPHLRVAGFPLPEGEA